MSAIVCRQTDASNTAETKMYQQKHRNSIKRQGWGGTSHVEGAKKQGRVKKHMTAVGKKTGDCSLSQSSLELRATFAVELCMGGLPCVCLFSSNTGYP